MANIPLNYLVSISYPELKFQKSLKKIKTLKVVPAIGGLSMKTVRECPRLF